MKKNNIILFVFFYSATMIGMENNNYRNVGSAAAATSPHQKEVRPVAAPIFNARKKLDFGSQAAEDSNRNGDRVNTYFEMHVQDLPQNENRHDNGLPKPPNIDWKQSTNHKKNIIQEFINNKKRINKKRKEESLHIITIVPKQPSNSPQEEVHVTEKCLTEKTIVHIIKIEKIEIKKKPKNQSLSKKIKKNDDNN